MVDLTTSNMLSLYRHSYPCALTRRFLNIFVTVWKRKNTHVSKIVSVMWYLHLIKLDIKLWKLWCSFCLKGSFLELRNENPVMIFEESQDLK